MIPLLLALIGTVEPDGVDILFPHSPDPVRLRVAVTVDSHSPNVAWADFLEKLFVHFDRDGDNALSLAESARVFPLPLPDGRDAKMDFAQLDSDKDGKATRAELQAFYRRAGFLPVVAVIRYPTADQRKLSNAVFDQLDRNHDGKLTLAEWKQAPDLLRRFDENEDEILDSSELLASETDVPIPIKSRLRVEPSSGVPDALLRFRIGKSTSPVQVEAKSPRVRTTSDSGSLIVPGGRVSIRDTGLSQAPGFRSAKEFYLAQFAEAIGDKDSIGKTDLESDAGLQAITGMFDVADRNGDEKLTSAEMNAFLELLERGVGCQVVVIVEDRGPSLFDMLDGNADGRLDLGELHFAARFQPIEKSQLPTQFRLTASRDPVGRTFGPVTVPIPARKAPAFATEKLGGPRWFHAMDRNSDGFLSAAEFLGPPARFTALDRNSDGRISANEADSRGK